MEKPVNTGKNGIQKFFKNNSKKVLTDWKTSDIVKAQAKQVNKLQNKRKKGSKPKKIFKIKSRKVLTSWKQCGIVKPQTSKPLTEQGREGREYENIQIKRP